MESMFTSIPLRSKYSELVTSNTGPIFVFWNPSFRLGFSSSRGDRMFSTRTSSSESCQWNVLNCHKIVSRRILSYKISVIAGFTRFDVFWRVSNLSLCCRTKFPWAWTLINVNLPRSPTTVGATFGFRFIIHLCHKFPCTWWRMVWNLLSNVLHTHPILLRWYWADWRRQWCEVPTLLSLNHRCSVSMFFHLFCSSKILWTTHLFLWLEDVRFHWD